MFIKYLRKFKFKKRGVYVKKSVKLGSMSNNVGGNLNQ